LPGSLKCIMIINKKRAGLLSLLLWISLITML
jgi:hypothetical protein